MGLIVVAGALANKPGNGGAAWTRLSWALGFKRLGHEVWFMEQIAPEVCTDLRGGRCDLDRSVNVSYFTEVTQRFGLGTTAALISVADGRPIGAPAMELDSVADAADLLVNISGHLSLEPLKSRFRKRVFIDLDPGYTQFWHAQGIAEEKLVDHHAYFTIGENIGRSGCPIPTGDINWRAIRQPVVVDDWPVATATSPGRFTTIASWRGPYGRITHDSTHFGLRVHEFRKFIALPTVTKYPFEIAVDIDSSDRIDRENLLQHHWQIVEPKEVAGDPFAFRRYVQQSGAECSIAQGIYVETQCGWFSDRTVRYLASGKPALVQDTGFGRAYPTGCGLVPFRTLEDAANGADHIMRDYASHSQAARAIAQEFFDSDKVLGGLLQEMGVRS